MNQCQSNVLVLEDGQAPPPGTISPPRRPHWFDTFAYIANPDQFCRKNLATHGPIFQTGVFGGTTVLVGSAAANQVVFNGDSHYTEISLPSTTWDMFGEYSLFQRPDLHRQRKTALRPGMTGQMLNGYVPQINSVIWTGLQSWKMLSRIALFPAIEQLCFDVLVPLLLGINLNQTQPNSFAGLPITSKAELKQQYKTFFDGFYGLLRWKSPLTAYGRGWQARQRLIELMRAIVKRRRATEEVLDPTTDFLAMMLVGQQEDPEGVFSDALIENQCLLQLWASHYEISGLVASLLYQLGKHPAVLERVRAEQTKVRRNVADTVLSPEQLKQMTFLDATIKETLRILPPSATATRRLTQSVVLDGVLYQKGWKLAAEPRIAHFIPDYFPDPDQFDPDRFLSGREEGKVYEFIPFGGGVHACLGAQMAMVVTKVFAAHFLDRFDWELVGSPKFVPFPIRRIADQYQIEIKQC